MPAQDGVGGEKRGDLGKELAAKDFPFDRQATALVIVQQDLELLLLAVDPAGQDEMEQLPGLQDEVHGGPDAEEKDGLASGLRPAVSSGRKPVHRPKVSGPCALKFHFDFHLRFGQLFLPYAM
jgi:hypothetical protein